VRNLGTGNRFRQASLQICLTVALALLFVPALAFGQTFVQQAQNLPNTDNGANATSTFPGPENAGDFNVVIVGWGDQMSSVVSVTDSNSNAYVLAGTSSGEGQTQAIYYAKNISVSTTPTATVTVTFNNSSLAAADVRVLEYTFASSAVTVDNWIGNSGGNSPATSNTVTTTTPSLIVAAGTTSGGFTSCCTPASLTSRGINTGFEDIAMDSVPPGAVAAGTYSAGASVTGGWVMQAAGFSIAGIITQTPTVTSIAPTSGAVSGGDSVTITGTNFSNGAVALFGTAPTGYSLLNCVVTPPTTMTCNTPAYNEGPKDLTVVNVDGKNGSQIGAFTYTINNPTITGISPVSTTTNGGTAITITGANFETGALVTVGGPLPQTGNGVFGDNIVVNNSTTITINAPAFSTGPENVMVNNPDGGSATDAGALTYTLGTGAINYLQRADAATGSTAQTVPAPMTNPQGKGNLNVVIIGWSDTSSLVTSVTDTEGNPYVQALPIVNGTSLSQVVYYAKNLVGDNVSCTPNCNTITVNFSRSASSPDVRVVEYSGLDVNSPLDAAVANFGNGTLADTGPCITASAVEVIVAAATVTSNVTGAGMNFTTVDYTFNGDNVEHQITSAVGSCEATTVMTGGNWVTQAVSFKAGAGAASGYTLTADPPISETVVAGSNASYALTVGSNSSSVTLSCSGLPTGAACSFSPSPVTPGSSTAVTLTISTTGSTPAGLSTVTITGTPAPSQTATVTLTVTANTAPGFTTAATALSPAAVSPGASATSTITITPVNGFTGSVAFSCSITGGGTPAPTCSFSTVTNGSSTLTVSTTANSASILPRSTGLFYALLLPIGGMTLLGAGFSSRRKMLLGILLVCMLIAGFIFMTACSSSGSSTTTPPPGGGTPAGTYTITVSGTATGATTQTQVLTLVVN